MCSCFHGDGELVGVCSSEQRGALEGLASFSEGGRRVPGLRIQGLLQIVRKVLAAGGGLWWHDK